MQRESNLSSQDPLIVRRDVTDGKLKERLVLICELFSHKELQNFGTVKKGKSGKRPSFDPKIRNRNREGWDEG